MCFQSGGRTASEDRYRCGTEAQRVSPPQAGSPRDEVSVALLVGEGIAGPPLHGAPLEVRAQFYHVPFQLHVLHANLIQEEERVIKKRNVRTPIGSLLKISQQAPEHTGTAPKLERWKLSWWLRPQTETEASVPTLAPAQGHNALTPT